MRNTEQEKLIMKDIKEVQKYLNKTYEGNTEWKHLEEDGVAGYNTMVGLVRALQIEMGIEADGGFGTGTRSTFDNIFSNGLGIDTEANTQQIKNIIVLINCGLMCRVEISNNSNDAYVYAETTRQGITSMMSQLGISNFTGNITSKEVKALMTSDAYYLISSGDATTREIQQAINGKYNNVLGGYIPTNGLYERNMNTALIKIIQYEIGAEVDGGWGEGTKSELPVLGPGSSRTNLIYILQYLLYLNGFDPNGFDGGFGNGVTTALEKFQRLMMLDVDGYCGRQVWSALVVSCGDTSRSGNACDTCFEITPERAQLLKNNGYDIVGRYLTGYINEERPKALQEGELETILDAGLGVFLIYQENARQISDFSYSEGRRAGQLALEAAINKKIPEGTVIYFAVDMDVYEEQIDEYIKKFFIGINNTIGDRYEVGIYGPRLVCQRMAEANLAVSSFVADMSSGFSCNVGQKMPSNWNYDQFKEIYNYGGELDIDKVTYRSIIGPLYRLEETTLAEKNQETMEFLKEVYDLAAQYHGSTVTIKENNLLVLQYIAYLIYDSQAWVTLLQYEMNGINYIKQHISKDKRDSSIYVNEYRKLLDLPHFCAAISSILNNLVGVGSASAVIADLAGWAGDLIQFAGTFEEAFRNNKYPSCSESIITQLLGGGSYEAGNLGFGLSDLIQDIDAWLLYNSLKNNRIDIVFSTYYNSTTFKNRGEGFVNSRSQYGSMPGEVNDNDSNYDKLYKWAKAYLTKDLLTIEGLGASAVEAIITQKQATMPEIKENVARAFATKVNSML